MQQRLTIGLSKGRILEETLPLLAAAHIEPKENPDTSRRLVLETNDPSVALVVLRAADVPTYVQYGAADIGVAGKDVLMEHGGEGLYEPLDLGIARCRLMVAEKPGRPAVRGRLRVATKFAEVTRRHFAARGRQVEVIKLYGSMELAPLVGLADCIVDLVATGKTLEANGLEAVESLADVSARLIVNKAAMKMKHRRIRGLVDQLSEIVERREDVRSHV